MWRQRSLTNTIPRSSIYSMELLIFCPRLNILKRYRLEYVEAFVATDLKDRGPDEAPHLVQQGIGDNTLKGCREQSPFVVDTFVGDRKSGTVLSNVLLAICL